MTIHSFQMCKSPFVFIIVICLSLILKPYNDSGGYCVVYRTYTRVMMHEKANMWSSNLLTIGTTIKNNN